jgi:multidrug efflux pump subunit AcrA (membrane-fusion protein)
MFLVEENVRTASEDLEDLNEQRVRLEKVDFWCQQISRKISGRISSTTEPKDSSSQDFSVRVILENPQALLRPGMIGQAKIFVK